MLRILPVKRSVDCSRYILIHVYNVVRQSRLNDSLLGKEQHLLPVLAVSVAEVITFHNEAFFIFSDGDAFPLSTCLMNQAKGRKAFRKLVLGGNGNTQFLVIYLSQSL